MSLPMMTLRGALGLRFTVVGISDFRLRFRLIPYAGGGVSHRQL